MAKKTHSSGFTLVEVMIAVSLLSIVGLAVAQIQLTSIRSAQSTAATDEFNSEISSVINLVNQITQTPGLPNQNGCTDAFFGMPLSPAFLPIISVAQALLPPPTPITAFNAYINSGVPAIAIYRKRATSFRPIIQVNAPTPASSNANFPPLSNNLWITNLYFKAQIDTDFIPKPASNPTWISHLYLFHIDAQKNGASFLSGGATVFQKEILITLWTDLTNTVVYCGGNPI